MYVGVYEDGAKKRGQNRMDSRLSRRIRARKSQ